jgi:hypothetical protein
MNGDALRLGIQGDRPSGFRSIYMLLNAVDGVNENAITGYMFTSSTQNPSRTLLVSRNMGIENQNGLKGNVIYVTRELHMTDKDDLLQSLEFLNVKEKNVKVDGSYVSSEITEPTIVGTTKMRINELLKNASQKQKELMNSDYQEWVDYDTEFTPVSLQGPKEVEEEKTDAEEARDKRKQLLKETKENKGISSEAKEAKKAELEREKNIAKEEAKRKKEEAKQELALLRQEEANKKLNIIEAKKRITELRTDISTKEKKLKNPIIPLNILDELSIQIDGLNPKIDESILNIIKEEAIEDDRIKKQALENVRRRKEEKERKEAEMLAYENSPEAIAENERIEEEKRQQELELEEKLQLAEQAKQNRIQEITSRLNELNNELISGKLEDKKSETQRKKVLNKQILELDSELRQLNKKRGGTLSNKKKCNHKMTKRQLKKYNKLTKRKLKKHKNRPKKTKKQL